MFILKENAHLPRCRYNDNDCVKTKGVTCQFTFGGDLMCADNIENGSNQMFHMIQLGGNSLNKIAQNVPWKCGQNSINSI